MTLPERARSIDLNADVGEGFPNDLALLALVSSANISCGAHAGDPHVIRETIEGAVTHAVCIGAHPGFADREGFGRREQNLTTSEVTELIRRQVEALMDLAAEVGGAVRYLKPHGALYNQAQRDPEIARGVIAAASEFRLPPLLGQPGSVVESLAKDHGITYIAEAFPDRRYRHDGIAAPRSEPGAMLHDERAIEEQVIRLAQEGNAATLCIHGTTRARSGDQCQARSCSASPSHDHSAVLCGRSREMGLSVIHPAKFKTVQDSDGRPCYAAWRVTAAGAFDPGSAELANSFLGNPADCAVLEITLLGGTYHAECPLALALSGAMIDAKIVTADRSERVLQTPSSFSLRQDERLVLGKTHLGARTYLAVRGGWQTTPILGSHSSEKPIGAGDHLAANPSSILSRHLSDWHCQSPAAVSFRIVAGPDARSTPEIDAGFWTRQPFRVGTKHDRKGLRLEGDPVCVAADPDRISMPVLPGRRAGGGRATDRAGGRVWNDGRLSTRRPGDFSRHRPLGPAQGRRSHSAREHHNRGSLGGCTSMRGSGTEALVQRVSLMANDG